MKIQIKISADTAEETKGQYEKFNRQMRAQGLHLLHQSALNPLVIEATYIDSRLWQVEQEKINTSCRNSLGGAIDPAKSPMINSILGIRDASGHRKE